MSDSQSFNTLESFISYSRSLNWARSNRFEIIITPPAKLIGDWGNENLKRFSIMVEDAAMPGRSMETAKLRIHGNYEQRVRAVDYFGEAINFTFYVDDTWDIKRFFQEWQDEMIDWNTRVVGFYDDYIGTIEIIALSVDEQVRHSITLLEAFPRSFQLIQVAQGSSAVQRLVVAIAFKRWIMTNQIQASSTPDETTVAEDANTNASIQAGPGGDGGKLPPKPPLFPIVPDTAQKSKKFGGGGGFSGGGSSGTF